MIFEHLRSEGFLGLLYIALTRSMGLNMIIKGLFQVQRHEILPK